ncbi:conserved hypothetical protein [Gloeothece citriformis PCC 7424]|uniref:Winged helix-turn helix domain-containing protein n=1 Tax=Gloeothece citriformis (strain PCC 7424) TaxID=65393 RepID=B7KC52_GLOC7|nr:helix-turn-helix domain-containing protein [Gloeothece citriformis]ACK68875.1 conserved hypothetical protein [Gloeothece citriformis PCC 7424]
MNTAKQKSPDKNKDLENFKTGKFLTPFQRKLLQKSCQNRELSEPYRQRLQIMLLADEGKSQAEICQQVGCCHGTARHWILMARTGQAHHWQDQPIGRPKAVNDQYLERLKELVNQSPKDCGYSFSRWTAGWLSKHLAKEFEIEVSDRHINRLLKQMGLSTRPKSPQTQNNNSLTHSGKRILIDDLSSHSNLDPQPLWHLQTLTFN